MRSAEEVTREVVQAKAGLAIDRILTEWQAEVAEQVRAEALADLTSRASKDKSIQGLQRATICSWLSRQVEP